MGYNNPNMNYNQNMGYNNMNQNNMNYNMGMNNYNNQNMFVNPSGKFCGSCGEKIHESAVVCPKCGCSQTGGTNPEDSESKKGIGIICGIFLGLIGLIIGYCCYKENTYARKTFMEGWKKAFFTCLIISIVCVVLYLIIVVPLIAKAAEDAYDYYY